MIRRAAVVLLLLVLASACGGGKKTPSAQESSTPSHGPVDTLTPEDHSRPKASPPAQVNRPKDGKYAYVFSGQVIDATAKNAKPTYTSGAERFHTIKNNGDVIKQTETSTVSQATTITHLRWRSSGVVEVSVLTKVQNVSSGCRFSSPLNVFEVPIVAKTFPAESLNGSGSSCGGTYNLRIVGAEKVDDANGKSWDTWKIVIKTHATNGNSDATETRWFSPALGKEIRIEGQFAQDASNGDRIKGESVNILKTYPSA